MTSPTVSTGPSNPNAYRLTADASDEGGRFKVEPPYYARRHAGSRCEHQDRGGCGENTSGVQILPPWHFGAVSGRMPVFSIAGNKCLSVRRFAVGSRRGCGRKGMVGERRKWRADIGCESDWRLPAIRMCWRGESVSGGKLACRPEQELSDDVLGWENVRNGVQCRDGRRSLLVGCENDA